MIIAIGSTNAAKVLAVKEVLLNSNLGHFQITSQDVKSEVSEQPLTLQETTLGAKNRAKNAFFNSQCKYAFGIESGFMESLETSTGYLHISVCSIYEGKNHYIGLSSGYEVPAEILDLVINKQMKLSQACLQSGISSNEKIGSTEGLIGVLTRGRIDRKEYSKQCIMTALLQLENLKWYQPNTPSKN
jgi:inosine/xanthosine triphosphatase